MFLLYKRGFRELPSAPRPFTSPRATAVQRGERERDYIPHTRTSDKKQNKKQNTHFEMHYHTGLFSPQPHYPLSPSSYITVSLPISSSCPHPPSTLHCLALPCTKRGKRSKVKPLWPKESNKTPGA